MNQINSQLTDAMIIALADAHDSGVNFSDAISMAKIPEIATVEANEYWSFLVSQNEFSQNIYPDSSIVDSILSKMETAVPSNFIKESTPSPYMKYVMIFTAPLSILVMIIGLSFRDQPVMIDTPSDDKLKPFAVESMNIAPASDAVTAKKAGSASPKSAASLRSAAPMMMMATADISNEEDPKQLFAMLSEAGSQESQSETQIDDEYEARLSALDSIVIDSDNINPYAPL